MVRSIIINADDFGFSETVNQAIVQAHTEGVLTSASLMVTADAAEQAISLAHQYPDLAVGLHLVLVCGRSALPPEQVPHLVDRDGKFSDDPVRAGWHYQFSRAARQELRQEIRAQLEKFRQTGLPLSHVDGHLHLHLHPVVLNMLTEFAPEFGIRAIRLPAEELSWALQFSWQSWLQKLVWSGVFGQLRRSGEMLLQAHNIRWMERVYGLLQTGAVSEAYWLDLIPRLQANQIELYCHPDLPAGSSAGATELAALLSPAVRQALTAAEFELVSYRQLIPDGCQYLSETV
jgi:hopanoid biosynthesis associated protein HpnK